MHDITIQTPARAGILGNPSDGFFGKTISILVRNFHAEIELSESDRIEILPGPSDHINFGSIEEMINDIKINGYYGGFRLIKAAIKKFYDYIKINNIVIPDKNFKIQYTSNIPRQVGLAGSSAIITSTIKALSEFYEIKIEMPILANYVLWAESKELGISAGLQDRVVQVYNEPVFMDFNENTMKKNGYGIYKLINPDLFPPLFLAYKLDLTHKDIAHNDVRVRWEKGDRIIRETMVKIGEIAKEGYETLKKRNFEKFNKHINKNFDLRASIYPITEKNLQMIKLARSVGATSKFPGSGGAIIGTFKDDKIYGKLKKEFEKISCNIVKIQL
ncbi:MAG: GHMP kinase [Candidatus Helarchaeota archaeon]|nr:GHMP kinase [Candidatus Helarchaeota archaeon]